MKWRFFVVLSSVLTTCNLALAGSCNYAWTAAELRGACSGIADELEKIKTMGTANVIVSAVGTGAAGGALYAGIRKSDVDKKVIEIEKQMQNVKNMSDADFLSFLKNMAALQEVRERYNGMCARKHDLQAQSKKLGNWRTGLMAGNTVTAVAGTVISNKNQNESGDIKSMIQGCLDTIQKNKQHIGQAQMDCAPGEYRKLQDAANACGKISTLHMDKVSKNAKTSKIVSAVNIGTGLAGTVTSAIANSNNPADENKGMDTAANVFAGASALASGTSTVFNAITLKAINENLKFATECKEAISKL